MVSSDVLHQLIHSLSKTEKKYFKETSSGLNYVKLFDAINGQEVYDEERLKKKFRNEAFAKNFSVTKNYLQESILRSLRAFNAGKLMDDVSYERFQNIRLLYEKGLVNAVEKQLPKLKEFCYHYEQFPRLLELLSFEMQLNNAKGNPNEAIYTERLRVLQIMVNIAQLNKVYDEILRIAVNLGYSPPEQIQRMDALMTDPILNEQKLCGVKDELYAFYNVFFVYHYVKKNFRESYLAKKKQYELYKDDSILIKTKPKTQLLMLGNLTSLAYNIPDIEEFNYAYSEMVKTHELVKGFEGLKFEQISSFGLLAFKLNREHSGFEKHVKYIEANLPKHIEDISLIREMDIYFNVAVAYFRRSNYGKALDWINKIINHKRVEEREQIHHCARQFELVLHYELKNYELIDYKITNTQRYLQKRNLFTDFDKILFTGFRQIIKAGAKRDVQAAFLALKTQLECLPAEELNKINTEQFEYINWIDGKLNAKSRQPV